MGNNRSVISAIGITVQAGGVLINDWQDGWR